MDARTIRLVQTSWAAAAAQPGLGVLFYRRLFETDPSLRPLFKDDLELQAQKLARMLDAVVTRLDDLDAFVPLLREMGARHELYHVRDEHYQVVGDVLIETLAQALGRTFTAETEIAWATAYSLIAQTMKSAAGTVRSRIASAQDPAQRDAAA